MIRILEVLLLTSFLVASGCAITVTIPDEDLLRLHDKATALADERDRVFADK